MCSVQCVQCLTIKKPFSRLVRICLTSLVCQRFVNRLLKRLLEMMLKVPVRGQPRRKEAELCMQEDGGNF